MEPFTTDDLKRWVAENNILKDDGKEYAPASIDAILANSDVSNSPTTNRNIKMMKSRLNKSGHKEYWFEYQ